MKNKYVAGTWNAICMVCGLKFKSSQLRERWDGLRVCSEDFETRHPQDLLRVSSEHNGTRWQRPEQTYQYITYALMTETSNFLLTEAGDELLTENQT